MDKNPMPEGRQALYYLGNFLIIFGFGLCAFVVISGALSVNSMMNRGPGFGGPDFGPGSAVANAPSPVPFFMGMGLFMLGGILRGIGAAGLAGSGIILDPKKQREDLKPWSQMAGGMLDDTLAGSDTVQQVLAGNNQENIKIRCQACRTLNDEDARFCDSCGKPL